MLQMADHQTYNWPTCVSPDPLHHVKSDNGTRGKRERERTVKQLERHWRRDPPLVSFLAFSCPSRLRAAATLDQIGTADREIFLDSGFSDALFIDGKEVRTGPPPSYEKLKGLIEKRVRKL